MLRNLTIAGVLSVVIVAASAAASRECSLGSANCVGRPRGHKQLAPALPQDSLKPVPRLDERAYEATGSAIDLLPDLELDRKRLDATRFAIAVREALLFRAQDNTEAPADLLIAELQVLDLEAQLILQHWGVDVAPGARSVRAVRRYLAQQEHELRLNIASGCDDLQRSYHEAALDELLERIERLGEYQHTHPLLPSLSHDERNRVRAHLSAEGGEESHQWAS